MFHLWSQDNSFNLLRPAKYLTTQRLRAVVFNLFYPFTRFNRAIRYPSGLRLTVSQSSLISPSDVADISVTRHTTADRGFCLLTWPSQVLGTYSWNRVSEIHEPRDTIWATKEATKDVEDWGNCERRHLSSNAGTYLHYTTTGCWLPPFVQFRHRAVINNTFIIYYCLVLVLTFECMSDAFALSFNIMASLLFVRDMG